MGMKTEILKTESWTACELDCVVYFKMYRTWYFPVPPQCYTRYI